MNGFSKFSLEITPIWAVISEIRKQIRVNTQDLIPELSKTIEIISCELLENAVKYGVADSTVYNIAFDFEVNSNIINISVKNGILENENLESFIQIMEEIKNSNNRPNLYLKRLKELRDNNEISESKIGLYRSFSNTSIINFYYTIKKKQLEIIVKLSLDIPKKNKKIP